jgi:hypothetical protein
MGGIHPNAYPAANGGVLGLRDLPDVGRQTAGRLAPIGAPVLSGLGRAIGTDAVFPAIVSESLSAIPASMPAATQTSLTETATTTTAMVDATVLTGRPSMWTGIASEPRPL